MYDANSFKETFWFLAIVIGSLFSVSTAVAVVVVGIHAINGLLKWIG